MRLSVVAKNVLNTSSGPHSKGFSSPYSVHKSIEVTAYGGFKDELKPYSRRKEDSFRHGKG